MTFKIEVPINVKGGSGKKIGEQIAEAFQKKSGSLMKSIGIGGAAGAVSGGGGMSKGLLKLGGIMFLVVAALDALKFIIKPVFDLFKIILMLFFLPLIPIIKPVMKGLAAFIKWYAPIARRMMVAVEKFVAVIGDGISWVWQNILEPIWNGLKDEFNRLFAVVKFIVTMMVTGFKVFLGIGEWLFNNMIKPGFEFFVNIGVNIWEIIKSPFEWLAKKIKTIWDLFKGIGVGGGSQKKSIFGSLGSLFGFAQGGTVPGAMGSPQLAVVHGGEEIIPAGRSGRSIVININNPMVRDNGDLKRLANEVSQVLQRKMSGRILNG